ncbi:DUF418 domain-containing protein [Wenyingzhuangia sp. IMCC45574]
MKSIKKNSRIVGIDVARALAVVGMIIVNFKIVFGDKGNKWIRVIADFFDGKAAATFVVLAGVGLALMTNSTIESKDIYRLKHIRKRIVKRALFLFLVGISYIPIWPADILHFYGVYMLLLVLLLTQKRKHILIYSLLIILIYPILITVFYPYELGWDFESLDYPDFWTLKGFVRNLLFNGFHPVLPWSAFMFMGYWLGKQDLNNKKLLKKIFLRSALCLMIIQVLSFGSLWLDEGSSSLTELKELLSIKPMPPLPMYMLNGITVAFTIISGCILLGKRFNKSFIIKALRNTGELALTFYIAHVVIGMGIVEVLNPSEIGAYSIVFSVMYALLFSLCCIIFAVVWRKYKQVGPMEWIMRKLTN